MSGHSKWHNIQGKKGKADAVRSNVFTKIARAITVAVREGGSDQTTNFSLRLAIEKAKAANMPKDNIDRAITRGSGEAKDGEQIDNVVYEGFGPAGVAILIETLTDNKNRTVSELKNLITKRGGTMGSAGSVKWMFGHLGVVRLSEDQRLKIKDRWADVELELIDAGAGDIIESEYGVEIRCPVESFQKVMEVVKKFGLEPESSGLEWVAKEGVELSEEDSEKVANLVEVLEELDDVKEVFTNEL